MQSARETLENAIRMVEAHPRWRARVVYGDTDSLFVLLPGRSRDEAFEIGSEIAAAATAANPPPVTLKMEKVRFLLTPQKWIYWVSQHFLESHGHHDSPELLPLKAGVTRPSDEVLILRSEGIGQIKDLARSSTKDL